MDESTRAFEYCVIWFGQPARSESDCLAAAGWGIRIAAASEPGAVGIRSSGTAVALADLRHASSADAQAMARQHALYPHLPWLVVVAADSAAHLPVLDHILQASIEVLTAPLDPHRLVATLSWIAGGRPPESSPADAGLIGDSPAIHAVLSDIHKYARVDLPVLITGETGTGKEVAARSLHHLSARRERPFEAINCGALPGNLVQSELFGHERGAFTGANARRIGHFELAAGGTVFLDEVAELPPDAQTSLLRLLQEGTLERVGSSQPVKLDVRVLAATHVDLDRAAAEGRFREDLYYRLNVLRLHMPALREHNLDIALLARHFLDAFRAQNRTRALAFSGAALLAMQQHAWPGNVRELRNRVQRAAVVAEGVHISIADLDLPATPPARGKPHATLDAARVMIERDTLKDCLRESRYNVSECARRLNVSRVTIYRLCKKHMLAVKSGH